MYALKYLIEHKSTQKYDAILFFLYTFLFHPNMLILELPILKPCLHSFAFKSNQAVSLHKNPLIECME